ncbi:hypothetical protein PAXINDRAFT_72333 [Paxillus involutus ATCC 200175]|nr:hypothetical protein PAXINDRAFT_72333 [Paxillus involutus ATCC 200175]
MADTLDKVKPALDPSLYSLDAESLAFLKAEIGIQDDDELKNHILSVQARAYAVAPYPCIRAFNFTRLKISKMPAYKQVLKLGQEREGALLLDIGCCFGNDARKAAADGFPAKQIVASDLKPELWELGHILFRSNPELFPATFVAGNALDPTFLSPIAGGREPPAPVDLSNISALNDLDGKVSAIWATSFFHLFSEKNQRQLAHALGCLLSPQSGSIIFGSHVAKPEKGVLTSEILGKEVTMFCHDPESWKELWHIDGPVFSSNSVKLDTVLREMKSGDGEQAWILVWSITRL